MSSDRRSFGGHSWVHLRGLPLTVSYDSHRCLELLLQRCPHDIVEPRSRGLFGDPQLDEAVSDFSHDMKPSSPPTKGEQNGCRQRLEGYLSYQQRLVLAVA
jgi:hypothetical protein